MPTWWVDWKKMQKFFFHGGLFFKSTLSVLRCTWTGWINLKIFLGHHINYLKLTFVCFQLQSFSTFQGLNNWNWKRKNATFETFPVGKQGWLIKSQISDLSGLSMCISKWIKWILKKASMKKKLHIFAIHSSSRHEKRCWMLERLFWLFQCSRNKRCCEFSIVWADRAVYGSTENFCS